MNQHRSLAKKKPSEERPGRAHTRPVARSAPAPQEPPLTTHLRHERYQGRMDIQQYMSPFPPAHILDANNRVDPRINDVMIEGVRDEMIDRRQRANYLAKADVEEAKRAQIFSLVTSLLLGGGAIGAIFAGHDTAGATVATGVLVALAVAFLGGPRRLRKDKDDHAE